MLDARAEFLNLADITRFSALLDDDRRKIFERLQPDGIVRNLIATVSDIDSDRLRYSVSANRENVGFSADGGQPGVRGFAAAVRWSTVFIRAASSTVNGFRRVSNFAATAAIC